MDDDKLYSIPHDNQGPEPHNRRTYCAWCRRVTDHIDHWCISCDLSTRHAQEMAGEERRRSTSRLRMPAPRSESRLEVFLDCCLPVLVIVWLIWTGVLLENSWRSLSDQGEQAAFIGIGIATFLTWFGKHILAFIRTK
jgi:hypothetical protein